MDLKIKDLKIGERLIFGKYGVRNDTVYPISWLKCNPNGDFITEFVLDYICFDANEPNNPYTRGFGCSNYGLSNIFAFINSADEHWYRAMHQYDEPPGRLLPFQQTYESHVGFLYNFEEYEIESLVKTHINRNISSIIRLPSLNIFRSCGSHDLFYKKGHRAKGTDDLIINRHTSNDFNNRSFIPFWLEDDCAAFGKHATFLDRIGNFSHQAPRIPSGLRPVCTMNLETPVVLGEDGRFYIQPHHVVRNVYTDEELFDLLGLTQP